VKTTDPGDAARIELLLAELRLPAVKLVCRAGRQGRLAGRALPGSIGRT
jgi:hypothetical protein